MADISKIKLPDNSEYDISVYTNHVKPIDTKTFTGVIGTAANWANATFFFGTVKPTDFNTHWKIRYRVHAQAAGDYRATATSDFTLNGINSTYTTYKAYNSIVNTSYRPAYYHVYYMATSAGITSYGHAMGLRLYSSWNAATAANARTFTIEILEMENCTFTFFDSMMKYASIPGTGSTNYAGYTEFDFASNGLQETGDTNDVNYYNRESYASRTTKNALYRYQFCVTDSTGQVIPINSVNNSVATNKTLMTDAFDPFGEIFFWNSTGTYSAGANVGNGYLYRQYFADLRYSFNCGGYDVDSTLTARLPLYLVVNPQGDGTVKLHSSPLSQTLPTSDNGLLYIYLGRVYEDSKPYRVVLTYNHPIYWYKDGKVRQYLGDLATTSKHGVTKLNTATNSTSTTEAATPSAVKTAYDLANTANGTANTALSGVNGTLIYDHTYSISNGVATFTAHVYQKGVEVTSNYADSCFSWSYKLASAVTGTPSVVSLGTGKTKTITISTLGYGGYVLGTFTPPA